MTVQPDTFPIRVNLIPNPDSQEDSDSYSQERPGADLTETFQIREYVPGDSMRQIHWKLSGKFDRLIVRDPALPITRNVLVFWERTGQSGSVKRIDAQAETVVSACRSLSDSGVQFTLGWNDTDSNVCVLHEIRGMEDLVGVIPRLLCAAGRKDGVGGASLLVQTRPDALCGHMVYIGEEPCADVLQMQRLGHVTALLCGESPLEGSIPFDPVDAGFEASGKTAVTSAKIPEDVAGEMESVLKGLGTNFSQVVRLLALQTTALGGMPFAAGIPREAS